MQHDNFRNLNRLIFIRWKHLETQVDTFWYYFKVALYLMKSITNPQNQSSFEILQFFVKWRYQSLVTLFFSSAVMLI